MLQSIRGGAAGSWTLDNLAPRMIAGNFDPGFMVEHFIKDMGIALDEAARMRLALPGLALVRQLYLAVAAQGHGARRDARAVPGAPADVGGLSAGQAPGSRLQPTGPSCSGLVSMPGTGLESGAGSPEPSAPSSPCPPSRRTPCSSSHSDPPPDQVQQLDLPEFDRVAL